jgi:hypothetical protein
MEKLLGSALKGSTHEIFIFKVHHSITRQGPSPVIRSLKNFVLERGLGDLSFFHSSSKLFFCFFVIYGCLHLMAPNQSPPVYESFLIIFCRRCFLLGELLQAVVVLVAHVLIEVLLQNVASRMSHRGTATKCSIT